MNNVIVTRHKYHIVRSLPGCTVRQEGAKGTVIETTVPADEDTPVFAHAGKWTIDGDDNVTVTEVFKLAPIAFGGGGKPGWYDVLRSELAELLGTGNFSLTYAWREDKFTLTLALPLEITDEQMAQVRVLLGSIPPRNLETEIDEMPIGFGKLKYIENTGGARIDSDLFLTSDYEINIVYDNMIGKSDTACIFGNEIDRFSSPAFNMMMASFNSARFDYSTGSKSKYLSSEAQGKRLSIDVKKNNMNISIPELNISARILQDYTEFVCTNKHYIFAINKNGNCDAKVRLYSLSGGVNDVTKFDFVPAFDKKVGAPCMLDKVRRMVFYNIGSGHFIAGVETQPQLDAVLRGLPDRTGQEVGELRLRLSDALYESAVVSGIIESTATAKNWQIAYDPTTEIAA